jgi:hypothetical protein
MGECGRWDEYEGPWGEFNNHLQFPQNQMAPSLGVKVTQRLDGTPGKWAVEMVPMLKGPDIGAKIECSTRKNALGKVSVELRHLCIERFQMIPIVLIEVWGPQGKSS